MFIRQIPLILSFPYEIIKCQSITEALSVYIYKKHFWIMKLRESINENFNGAVEKILDHLPNPDALVDYIWGYLGKQIIIFVVSFGLFLLTFNFLLKPRLLSITIGVNGIKIYAVPFVSAIDYFFKTNLMQWLIQF
jgi:hypothetical protein